MSYPNWIKDLCWKISEGDKVLFSRELKIAELNGALFGLQTDYEEQSVLVDNLSRKIGDLEKQIPKIDPTQIYWDNKRPKTDNFTYPARSTPFSKNANIDVDPRVFLTTIDNSLPVFSGSRDEVAMQALKYVYGNLTYTTDLGQFKRVEEWLFPFETLYLKKGDCEDLNIAIAAILIHNGIPSWRVRVVCGDVNVDGKNVGHCWCTYLREKDNQWVLLDAAYWPTDSMKGLLWKDAEKYLTCWFSFSKDHIYAKDYLDREIQP